MSITCCITCSRIHYMLPNPLHAPESITCSRIHYMLPNPLHAPESITWHYILRNPLHASPVITWHLHAISACFLYFAPCADRDCHRAPVSHQPDASACDASPDDPCPGTGAVAGSSSISSTHVDAAGTADPGPAASTIAFPPLRYVFNAVLSASRLDE
jgi:hypothetical protein